MVSIIFMPAAGAFECFQNAVVGIQIPAHRTHLAGKVRNDFHKVIAFPVQCFHQFLLEFASCKHRKLPVYGLAFVEFTKIQFFQDRHGVFT